VGAGVDIITASGHVISVDEVDYDFAAASSWRAWSRGVNKPLMAANDEARNGRRFRRLLHREIVLRMLGHVPNPRLLTVKAVDGDFLNASRENLTYVLVQKGRGRAPAHPHAPGYCYKPYRGNPSALPHSKLWSGGVVFRPGGPDRRITAYVGDRRIVRANHTNGDRIP
jgi:hypothetical protein